MSKTPGLLLREKMSELSIDLGVNTAEKIAEYVIAHATPAIEAKARAAAIEECVAACSVPDENGGIYTYWPVVNRIRAIAAAPAWFVCVPTSLMEQLSKVLSDYAEDAEESGQLRNIVREIEFHLSARPK